MSGWYDRVTANPDDLNPLVQCIEYFEKQLEQTRDEVKLDGLLERQAAEVAALFDYRFTQLQEIEAILEFLTLQCRKTYRTYYQKYIESYNRDLSDRQITKYVEGEGEVVDAELIKNRFALVRNKYMARCESLTKKHFQITNIVKLRAAGIEDAIV